MTYQDELREKIDKDASVLFLLSVKELVDMELPPELLSMEGTHEELTERAKTLLRILRKHSRPQATANAMAYRAMALDPSTSSYTLYERSVQLENALRSKAYA